MTLLNYVLGRNPRKTHLKYPSRKLRDPKGVFKRNDGVIWKPNQAPPNPKDKPGEKRRRGPPLGTGNPVPGDGTDAMTVARTGQEGFSRSVMLGCVVHLLSSTGHGSNCTDSNALSGGRWIGS